MAPGITNANAISPGSSTRLGVVVVVVVVVYLKPLDDLLGKVQAWQGDAIYTLGALHSRTGHISPSPWDRICNVVLTFSCGSLCLNRASEEESECTVVLRCDMPGSYAKPAPPTRGGAWKGAVMLKQILHFALLHHRNNTLPPTRQEEGRVSMGYILAHDVGRGREGGINHHRPLLPTYLSTRGMYRATLRR